MPACRGESAGEAYRALEDFAGPKAVVRSFYSDNSPELIRAAKDLAWIHGTATPGRPATNGVAERAVRSVLDGTRTILENAEMPLQYWTLASRHWCFSHNIETRDGDSSWNQRHKTGHFKGLRVPFGAKVDFLPSPIQEKSPKFGPRAISGVFLGYHILPGGKWKGDILAASLEDF